MSELYRSTTELAGTIEENVTEYAKELGISRFESLPAQPPYQAYKADDRYIIKAHVIEDADKELDKAQKHARIIHQLHDSGAAVMEFAAEPRLRDNVLMTVSPFYPEKLPPTPEGYALIGHAVASLHNAGWQQTGEFDGLKVLDPLPAIWSTLRHLEAEEAAGAPFRIGNAIFPKDALQLLKARLIRAQSAFDEMMERASKDSHLTTVCRDVHPGNVLLDTEANPRIIDLMDNLAIGPPEYDLARPSAHWVERIGRSPQARSAFFEGYDTTLRPEIHIDQRLLLLATEVSDTYYAVSMLKNAVRGSEQGQPSNEEWRILEVINRLESLDNPTQRWRSFIDYSS